MDYPDIPQLESVEHPYQIGLHPRFDKWPNTAFFIVMALQSIAASIIIPITAPVRSLGLHVVIATMFGLFTAAMISLAVTRMRRDAYWRTDPEYLLVRTYLGERRVPWADVESIERSPGNWGEKYAIRARNVVVYLPADAWMLIASVWQHLRHHGLAPDFRPSDGVMSTLYSFWIMRAQCEPDHQEMPPADERAICSDDLPQLESVKYTTAGRGSFRFGMVFHLLMLTMVAALAVGCMVGAATNRLEPASVATTVAIVLRLMLIGTVVWMIRLLGAEFYWRTDAEGLLSRGIVRLRFIKWADVESVSSAGGESGRYHLICSSSKVIRVPEAGMLPLAASVWQHLRRQGKDEGFGVSREIRSLWERIPESVPQEMDWTNPRPPAIGRIRLKIAVATCVVLGLWIETVLTAHPKTNWWLPSAAFVGLVVNMHSWYLRPALRVAFRAQTTPDELIIHTTHGARTIPWSSITDARWEYGLGLQLQYGRESVVIPDLSGSRATDMLVLAVIRRLRQEPSVPLVPVPSRR